MLVSPLTLLSVLPNVCFYVDVWIRENQQDVENFFLPHDTCLTSYIREKYNLKAICMIGNELLSEEEKAAHVCELPTSCDDPICIYTILGK